METWADISKAKNLLGWEPQVSLEEGLEKSVQWYMDNRNWLKEIFV
jgi:nucleoside-diphosphate-sugar epimerase